MPDQTETTLPPDAAVIEDNQNPRRRGNGNAAPDLGVLVQPEPHHALDRLILHEEVRTDILAGLRSIRHREQLESVWNISQIQPQRGRCILNFYGPPGTGKTRAALGVAFNSASRSIRSITAP